MESMDRPDIEEAMRNMGRTVGSYSDDPMGKSLRRFQVFAGVLLVSLMLITSLSFFYSVRADRIAREAADVRRGFFEQRVEVILDTIQESQGEIGSDIASINEMLESYLEE